MCLSMTVLCRLLIICVKVFFVLLYRLGTYIFHDELEPKLAFKVQLYAIKDNIHEYLILTRNTGQIVISKVSWTGTSVWRDGLSCCVRSPWQQMTFFTAYVLCSEYYLCHQSTAMLRNFGAHYSYLCEDGKLRLRLMLFRWMNRVLNQWLE